MIVVNYELIVVCLYCTNTTQKVINCCMFILYQYNTGSDQHFIESQIFLVDYQFHKIYIDSTIQYDFSITEHARTTLPSGVATCELTALWFTSRPTS